MLPLRSAVRADVPAIRALIAASVRGLSEGYYSPAQVEHALVHVFGVDTQLVDDGTYYVVEDGGTIAAAGGWSARRMLFGGDQMKATEDPRLDPATDAARIRAFFVHPSMTRRGLARRIYERCETEAGRARFRRFELMATLPGEPLYRALGFTVQEATSAPLPGGLTLPLLLMTRAIGGAAPPR